MFCASHIGWGWVGGEDLGAGDQGPEIEDSTDAGSTATEVRDGYCPAVPHLWSAQLQLKAAAA